MLNWRDPRNPQAGGAERVTLAYLRGLKQRGHEVFWFANEFDHCSEEEVFDGIQLIRGGRPGKSILKAIRWYRRQKPFDLVIDQHHGIPWVAPWWSKTNCVAYIHEVLGPIWNAFYSWPLNNLGCWQERWTHWLYRKVPFWTPSPSTKRALHAHGVRDVTVFPNGTDATPLAALETKQLQLPFRLVAVSRLAPNKRVDHAIEAARLLRQAGIETHLVIVGSGDSEAQLRQMASQPGLGGSIRFTGQLSEAQKNVELQRAHFLVHTSIREGWGLNVIEANAMGTPAVVYPVGGLVDSTVHGQTGLITAKEAPEAVVESLRNLLKSPEEYDAMRRRAWERSKTFLWEFVLPPACDWLEKQAAGPR